MSSGFEKFYNQINSVVPDLNTKNYTNTQEFFGYLLISQIETVESVGQLEKKVILIQIYHQLHSVLKHSMLLWPKVLKCVPKS